MHMGSVCSLFCAASRSGLDCVAVSGAQEDEIYSTGMYAHAQISMNNLVMYSTRQHVVCKGGGGGCQSTGNFVAGFRW